MGLDPRRTAEGSAAPESGGELPFAGFSGSEPSAKDLFQAMILHRVSRNKYYSSFANSQFRRVYRRYRLCRALQREADRLAGVPGSGCWVQAKEGGLHVHLESPTLHYKREVALLPHEWEWLGEQTGIRSLLAAAAQGKDGRAGLVP
jgi:hypothetical protein